MKNKHLKTRDRVNIAVPRTVHAVLRSVADRTGRSIESVAAEALETGMKRKRWITEETATA
jgi:hypothetical protein